MSLDNLIRQSQLTQNTTGSINRTSGAISKGLGSGAPQSDINLVIGVGAVPKITVSGSESLQVTFYTIKRPEEKQSD